MGLGEKHLQAQEFGQSYVFYVPGEVKGMSAPIASKRPEEREFVVDSGASMHMMSKKELISEEMGTVKRSRNHAVVLTANEEVHTHEETCVLQLGKLCKDHCL